MFEATPGQTITIAQDGLATGLDVGFQVIKAASGTISIGRSTAGVVERPSGSGNYIATFVAPVEADLYLVVLDWSDGVISAETSVVEQLVVTQTAVLASSGLGVIADYTKVALGGSLFNNLLDDVNYGSGAVSLAIGAVKARVMNAPLSTDDEALLPTVVASYFGKLAALELMPAVRSMAMMWEQSKSKGSDPTEVVTYGDRIQMLDRLQDRLLEAVNCEWPIVSPLIPNITVLSFDTADIDECDDMVRVTADPRTFPREITFPYHHLWPANVRAGVWP